MIKRSQMILLLMLTPLWGCGEHQSVVTDRTPQATASSSNSNSIVLSDTQLKSLEIARVGEHDFVLRSETVGTIAFNDDKSVQVFPSYQGKISKVYVEIGQDVAKGKILYTIDSPDLVQAESTLIAAAGVRELTSRALERAKQLYSVKGLAEKDLQQAISDQQGAEGAYRAARDAVRIFGKTDAEIDRIIAERKVDPVMPVKSPINGHITAMSAPIGLLVQPGNAPAPFTVSDLSTIWMIANVPEKDIPSLSLGETVEVKVSAYPDRLFRGKVTNIGASVDPNTHRVAVRSELLDPKHELHPGMFATFVITTGMPVRSAAVPLNGVVREGDGTMTVWVTNDAHRFTQRQVKIGLQQDGVDQILEGLHPGELIATDGAIFLSNTLATATR